MLPHRSPPGPGPSAAPYATALRGRAAGGRFVLLSFGSYRIFKEMAESLELWRAVPKGAHEILPERKCPACGSQQTHRSRVRTFAEKLGKAVTPLRPFTCTSCGWRGWRVPIASVGPLVELPPLAPLPARRHHKGKKKHLSGTEHAIRRGRIQIAMTVALGLTVALGVVRCQQGGAVPSNESP